MLYMKVLCNILFNISPFFPISRDNTTKHKSDPSVFFITNILANYKKLTGANHSGFAKDQTDRSSRKMTKRG